VVDVLPAFNCCHLVQILGQVFQERFDLFRWQCYKVPVAALGIKRHIVRAHRTAILVFPAAKRNGAHGTFHALTIKFMATGWFFLCQLDFLLPQTDGVPKRARCVQQRVPEMNSCNPPRFFPSASKSTAGGREPVGAPRLQCTPAEKVIRVFQREQVFPATR
jgi:hypothetical protein